jgi:hypothetical protein
MKEKLSLECESAPKKRGDFSNVMGLLCMTLNLLFFTLSLALTKEVFMLNSRVSTFEVFSIGTGV